MRRMVSLSASFFAGSAFARVVGFLLLPIYTVHLTPAEFGYFDLSVLSVSLVSALIFSEIWVAVMRLLLSERSIEHFASKTLTNASIIFLSSIAVFSLVAAFAHFLFRVDFVWLMWGIGVSTAWKEFAAFSARGQNRNRLFVVSGLANAAVLGASTFLLLTISNLGLVASFLGVILGNLAQLLILESCGSTIRHINIRLYDRTILRRLIHFSAPLGLNAVLYWLMTGLNKFVVGLTFGLDEFGLFAVASRFSSVLMLLSGVITLAWQSVAFSSAAQNAELYFGKAIRAAVIFFGGAAVFAVPVIFVLFRAIISEQYAGAISLLPSFVLVAAMSSISTFIGNIFYSINQTRQLLLTTVVSVLAALVLIWPMASMLGMPGANFAIALAFAVGIACKFHLLLKSFAMRIPVVDILVFSCAFLVTSASVLVLDWTQALVAINLILVGLACVYWKELRSAVAKLRTFGQEK